MGKGRRQRGQHDTCHTGVTGDFAFFAFSEEKDGVYNLGPQQRNTEQLCTSFAHPEISLVSLFLHIQ